MVVLMLVVPLLLSSPSAYSEETPLEDPKKRKKILILSSNGGYGHTSAANTLKTLLGDIYDFKVVYPIDELRIWGLKSGEQIFYNTMLRWGWVQPMNLVVKHVAPRLFQRRQKRIEKLISEQIEAERPDLIISLIPFINYPATEAARKRELPYLLVTTDNDLRNWVHGLQSVKHPNFKVTIGSDLPSTRELLRGRNVPDSAIETIGLPLRPDFYGSKNLKDLQLEYGIPSDKPVVLIMMGGAGGDSAIEYTQHVGNLNIGAHLLVCTGKNKQLARKLRKLKLDASNSITIMGFTDKIADLMAMADVIITKPGPGTINEAMAMRLPVLVDQTTVPLSWEKANIDLIIKYGIGDRVRSYQDMESLLVKYLHDCTLQSHVQQAFHNVPLNHFHEKIPNLIDRMLKT
jgi:processive 1,2-diacylglycerol beta-glucosyltransferase